VEGLLSSRQSNPQGEEKSFQPYWERKREKHTILSFIWEGEWIFLKKGRIKGKRPIPILGKKQQTTPGREKLRNQPQGFQGEPFGRKRRLVGARTCHQGGKKKKNSAAKGGKKEGRAVYDQGDEEKRSILFAADPRKRGMGGGGVVLREEGCVPSTFEKRGGTKEIYACKKTLHSNWEKRRKRRK